MNHLPPVFSVKDLRSRMLCDLWRGKKNGGSLRCLEMIGLGKSTDASFTDLFFPIFAYKASRWSCQSVG